MQASPPAADQTPSRSSPTSKLQALTRSVSRPVYNERGNIVFGACANIHKLDSTKELVEVAEIAQGMESLSCPPWQSKDVRTDHNGDPLSYTDALKQDPTNWPPAIEEELKSHEENGTWVVQETNQMPNGCKAVSRSPASRYSSVKHCLMAVRVSKHVLSFEVSYSDMALTSWKHLPQQRH